MSMKVVSLFAGVGGIDIGFEQAGFEVILANEIDNKAVNTYTLNHKSKIIEASIKDIEIQTIPDHDVLLAGFPCQAFSVAGYRKGFEDERGELFFDVLKIVKKKKPSVVFLENVKNLYSHDNGNTFKVIHDALSTEGYFIKYEVLNGKDHGNVPQNRERIYIVAFQDIEHYKNFEFPDAIPLSKTIGDIVDYNNKVDEKYYYTSEKFKRFSEIKDEIQNKDTVYQWRRQYVRENKSNVCPTLTANMGTGGHNVPLVLTKHGIRKLTPHECFMFQGYPKDFKLPIGIAESHLYKQAGNSVVVPVIRRIAEKIKIAMKG